MLAYSQQAQMEKVARWLGLINALFILALFVIFAASNEFARRQAGHAPCIFEAFELVAIFMNLPARLLGYQGLGWFIPQAQVHTHYLIGYIFWSVLAYVQWRLYPTLVFWLRQHRHYLRWVRPIPILATLLSLTVLWLIWPKIGSFEGKEWERLMLVPVYVFSLAGFALTLLALFRMTERSNGHVA